MRWLKLTVTYDGGGYSPLDQINRDNVGDLRMVWALALGGMLWTGRRLVRAEAVLLLGGYAAYMGSLALNHG